MMAVVAGDVGDATFAGLNLSPRETMELILAVGFYLMLGRVMDAVDVDPEPAADVTIEECPSRRSACCAGRAGGWLL